MKMPTSSIETHEEKEKFGFHYGKMKVSEKGVTVDYSPNREKPLVDIIQRTREGEEQAMGELYERFKTPVFNLAYRYTYNRAAAEDLLQDIFVKIFTHIHELDKAEAFKSWMYKVSVNTCLSYVRSNTRFLRRNVSLTDLQGSIEEKNEGKPDTLMRRVIEEAIQNLSTKLKSIFLLHDVQGFKHEEIAQIMECSVGTSKSQLFKARMKIRKQLEKKQVV